MAQIKIANAAALQALASNILGYYEFGGNINKANGGTVGLAGAGNGLTATEGKLAVSCADGVTISDGKVVANVNTAKGLMCDKSKLEVVVGSGLKFDDGAVAVDTATIATQSFVTDKGYQTASQVNTAITGKGYQTAAQVETAITGKGYQTAAQVSSTVSSEIAKVVGGAPETYDTLKEIADYITTHGSEAAAMSSSITNLQNTCAKTSDFVAMTTEDVAAIWTTVVQGE